MIIVAPFDCTKIPAAEHAFGTPNHDVVTTLNVNNIWTNMDNRDADSCSASRGDVRRRLLRRFRRALVAIVSAPDAPSGPWGGAGGQTVAAATAGQRIRPHAPRVLGRGRR
jgi:hypothetical protein